SILATFKPDFSQIEADEDQLNISDYPLELDEKRPFFLEGNELYETPTDIYYSRRMTRPEYGAKFFGSAGFLKYGMTLVNNDGLYEDNGGSLLRNNEYFLIPRIKYVKSSSFSLGYLGGFVDSQYGQSGQLHSTDLLWRATNYIDVIGIFAKTSINGKSDFNEQYGFNVEYDTDAWEAEIGMQKISNNFALGLIGFPDPNNYAQLRGRLQRLFRFENSTFQELRFEAVLSNKGTYDFSAPTTNYSASIRVRQHLDYFGGISYGFGVNGVNGYFRNYDISAPSALYDNYGQFEAVDENGSAFNFFFDSDFSKAFGYFIRFEQQRYKQTDIINIQNNIQIKPIDDILIRFEINLRDIGPSQYLEEGTIWRINYKMNYSLLPNVFIRIFSQFNSQRDRLSNNLIINYEYVRGSFIYFAYNEVGTLDDSFNQGSFINNYNLDRRTFSLKWTYSFYL
ncbi:MAG: hypothetical protein KDD94_07360, partial [Calditrichaeota bacterium]|nr:hypothetical protein [Calditrichota bacterium]